MLIGFPLGTGTRGKKTRMMGLLGRVRSLTISSAAWIQYTNMTDRHRATAKTALTHSVVKNDTAAIKHQREVFTLRGQLQHVSVVDKKWSNQLAMQLC